MRALITGGGGFIGLHLARGLIAGGWSVDLLDDLSKVGTDDELAAFAASANARLFSGSLLDPALTDSLPLDYDVIFHFAALLGVQNVIDQPFEVLRRNVDLTAAAIDIAARQGRLGRFVFASTSEVYAGTLESFDLPVPTLETVSLAVSDLAHPRTSYMLSKIFGEAMCRHCGLPFTIVRPHNIYGPRMGMRHVVPQLLEKAVHAVDGGTLEVYSVDHTRAFCFVDDAVEMLLHIVENSDCQNEALNLGTQAPEVTIRELADIIIDVVGKDLTIDPKPSTQGSPVRRAPDMSRCTQLIGFESQVGLREGVARTFAWYRDKF